MMKNKEAKREYDRKWVEKNRARTNARLAARSQDKKDRQAALQHIWYINNKERVIAQGRERRNQGKLWRASLKEGKTCKYCPESFPRCLDWHHLDRKTKLFSISQADIRAKNKDKVLTELAKCELVCANCHRKIEAGIILENYGGLNVNKV